MSKRFHSGYASPNTADVTAVTNLISNGKFDNTTGWTGSNASVSAVNNILSATGSGASATARAYQTTGTTDTSGIKIYIKGNLMVTNADCLSNNIKLIGSVTAGAAQSIIQSAPVINTWKLLSDVLTLPDNGAGYVVVRFEQTYVNSATANGKVLKIQYALAIDLSTLLGVGQEPLPARIDKALSMLNSISWFDGSVNIPTEWMTKDAIPKLGHKRFGTLIH